MKTTIRVNRKRPESMTKQITDQLTGLIESGAMTVGSYLPSERELANSLKVARNVVRGGKLGSVVDATDDLPNTRPSARSHRTCITK